MKKASILIAACALVALVTTLFGQAKDLQPIMKEIGPLFTGMTAGMRGNRTMSAAEVAKNADKLATLFKDTAVFMKEKNLEKAVAWANDGANAASELAKAAKANDADAMFAARGTIQKQCGACHAVHREQLPDKTYKLKMQ